MLVFEILVMCLSLANFGYAADTESVQSSASEVTDSSDLLSSFVEADIQVMSSESQATSDAGGIGMPVPKLPLSGLKLSNFVPKPGAGPAVPFGKPLFIKPHAPVVAGAKLLKVAAPVKKTIKAKLIAEAAIAKKFAGSKLKSLPILQKPKVTKLKPIVHVVYKPVPVFHKVPVPKKVLIPKPFPVPKLIPVPKIIPVPMKVPVFKVLPKIVKIPKAIPIPKIVPIKKVIPIGIPVPVPKIHKFPVLKPVPFMKPIPIPIPKPFPKFVPVPVKKIIKVPKPYYVPVKVPFVTKSYVKTPMVVPVPAKQAGIPIPSFMGGHSMKPVGGSMIGDSMSMFSQIGSAFSHFGTGATAFGGIGKGQSAVDGTVSIEGDSDTVIDGINEGNIDIEAMFGTVPNPRS